MLALHKQLQEAHTPYDETALQRQIEATDRQIDARVLRALWADGGGDLDCGRRK